MAMGSVTAMQRQQKARRRRNGVGNSNDGDDDRDGNGDGDEDDGNGNGWRNSDGRRDGNRTATAALSERETAARDAR